MAQMCIQNFITFNQTQDCFTVFCDVLGGKEEKSSTQDPNKRTHQEADLQAVEAPVEIIRFRWAYSIRYLAENRESSIGDKIHAVFQMCDVKIL